MKPIPMPTDSDIDRYTDEAYERTREAELGLDVMKVIDKAGEK